MTEVEWLVCADPKLMLDCLRLAGTNRKLRLFACACVREVWHLLTGERGREAVRTAERFADGLATRQDLCDARNALWDARPFRPGGLGMDGELDRVAQAAAVEVWEVAGVAARAATSPAAWAAAANAADAAARVLGHEAIRVKPADCRAGRAARDQAWRRQCDLLRDVFGNPFRPVFLDPAWLCWNGACISRLAQAIYEERRFDDLPVLADALEEAGCTDREILGHCRQGGGHVPGCWVVDVVRSAG